MLGPLRLARLRSTHRGCAGPLAGLLLLTLLAPGRAAAQARAESRPTVEAYALPAETDVILDGRLNEPFWDRADVADGFLQQEPDEGSASTERTVVKVAFDGEHLYLGAMLYDSDPDAILDFQRQRDASLSTDDRFMWILDTYDDGRSAYFFEINPAGLMGDGLLTTGQGTNLNKDWDGIWEARVTQGVFGWSAEIRIPFRTLNFNPEQSMWGINFQRTIRRRNEELVWSGYRRNQGLFRPQNAGRLVGLRALSQGIGLEVTPYATAGLDRTWQTGPDPTDRQVDAGFDLTYSVTPNLRASLTVNTDFAETEVDDRRVNLTRFPLRFPEKRDFFLEGSSVFTFAPSSGVDPYFSRRIGLVGGNPVPVRFGARLAGQVGRFDVGFLQVRTGTTPYGPFGLDGTVDREDFTVARVKAHIFDESTFGVIYTRRASAAVDLTAPVDVDPPADLDPPTEAQARALDDRHTLGVDLELGTSTFRGDKNLQFQAFFIAHTPPVGEDETTFFDRTTRGIRLSYPNAPFFGHVSYREFGSAYDPAVGFNPRNGFRRLQPSVGYAALVPSVAWLREVTLEARHEYLMDLDFRPETVNTTLTVPEVRFESGDGFAIDVGHEFERLRAPFDIRRDGSIIVPPGRYNTYRAELELESAPFRRIAAAVESGYGGFWTGTRADLETRLSVKPLPGVSLEAAWAFNHVALDGGAFDTHLFQLETGFDVSPWTSLIATLQYDNLSRVVGLYSRLRWIIQPGSDLFLVYTHNWLDGDTLAPLSRQATTKLTYTYRF